MANGDDESDTTKNCKFEVCCDRGSDEQHRAVAACVPSSICSAEQARGAAAIVIQHYDLAPTGTLPHFRVELSPAALAALWPLSLGLSVEQGLELAACFLAHADFVQPAGSLSTFKTEIARLAKDSTSA